MRLRNILLLIIITILVLLLLSIITVAHFLINYEQDIANILQNVVDNNINPQGVWNYLQHNNITPDDILNYLNQVIDDYFSSFKLFK